MIKDPILEEIHRTREEMWRECGGTLQKYAEYLRQIDQDEQLKDRLIGPEDWKRRRAAEAGQPEPES